MKSEELAVLREMLEKQLHELSLRAETTISTLLNTPADFEPDPLDRAIDDQSRAYTLRLRGRESQLISKIKGCLAAIEDGSYGICESCEEPIAFKRLLARPVTSYCINCKNKLEKLEKIAGY